MSDDEAFELDVSKSAYATLPEPLRRFVDGLVAHRPVRELAQELNLSPSYASVLTRRGDIQDALREALSMEYGPRIMGDLELLATLSSIARNEMLEKTGDRIAAMRELGALQGLKESHVQDAKRLMAEANRAEIVITREEGAGGTQTAADVAAMEEEES